jgi:regulator of RNase E activity RraA
LTNEELAAIAERFKRLYTPAVCDVLDGFGLRHQSMHHSIRLLDRTLLLAGPAFTIAGIKDATLDVTKRMGPKVIDHMTTGVVAVYDTGGDDTTGVWGELWSAGASARGCVGAVVDGGIRDTGFIRSKNFPIFLRFTSPYDAVGRFTVADFNCPINAGGVRLRPGDYIFGDEDGVVVIPRELTLEVLELAEKVSIKESRIRAEIAHNRSLAELYAEYGKF